MTLRSLKALYYFVLSWAMVLNGWRYRKFSAAPSSNAPADLQSAAVKVHLGPGQRNYLTGWLNLDANFISSKIDLWVDLRAALPFNDNSVDAYYSHHVIEHLPNLEKHFREVFRTLKPGGVYRVGGPHGDMAIKKFVAGDLQWFPTFPDERSSIGGRFENFIFCRQEHLTILTWSYLEELMFKAGFRDLKPCIPTKESHYPAIYGADVLAKEFESDFEFPHTLLIEAQKPSTR